jgi:hypothetical protein
MPTEKTPLHVVGNTNSLNDKPPRPLGKAGMQMWKDITSEFQLEGSGERHVLWMACAAIDRVEYVNPDMRADMVIKAETSNTALAARLLKQLGVVGRVRKPGRPTSRNLGYDPTEWENG